ncbi:MAG: aspartyl protease family protein [Pyrinomonadaceae bacterium]
MRFCIVRASHLSLPTRNPVRVFILNLILVSSCASAAFPAVVGGDEVSRLIRQAAKLVRANSYPEAEETLRRAVELSGGRSDAKLDLAFVLTKRRKLLEAYDLSFEVAKAEPNNARAYSVLGTTLLTAGKFREARIVLMNAIKLSRKEHLAWAGFGLLDFYENKIDASFSNLREAVTYAPREPDYLFALGQVAARGERYTLAADAYQQFLKVSNVTDKDRRDRIKGLITFLRYLGENDDLYSTGGRDRTTVPFDLVGDRPVVNIRINGKAEPLRFVLDTGSGISVLSEDTAKRLKIKPITKGGYARGLGGDGRFPIVYGFIRQVELGDIKLKSVPVYIRKFHNDAQNVDGYIGLSLISKFLATIDYGAKTFSLTRKSEDTRSFNDRIGTALPLRLTSSGFLSGEVELEGMESSLNFIVDTGASVSVISESVAKSDAVSPFLNVEKLRVIGSAGITDAASTFSLPRLTFGTHTRRDIMAVALDLDLINEASGFEQSGILGGNFLKSYRLTFDFKNSKVIFVPVRSD